MSHRAKGAKGLGKRQRSPSPDSRVPKPTRHPKLKPKTYDEVFVPKEKRTFKGEVSWALGIKNKPVYVELRKEGFSKEDSARISNSKSGKSVHVNDSQTYAQQKAAVGPRKYKRKTEKIKK